MSRKRKISNFQTTAVDRISECPDSVLSHILSLLPIEDAVKTEVLSKRWQFLWTFLPSFLFHFHSSYSMYDDSDEEDSIVSRTSNFVTFVDKTLFFSNCSKLKKFGVDFGYEPRFASNVNSWTRFAVGKGVEELCLEFHSAVYRLYADELYELPQLLYANSWFKELRFSVCRVTPKGNVAWNSLKKLSIGYVKLSDGVIEKILAGSPVLEVLELCNYGGFSRLDLSNTSVKKLILREFWEGDDEDDDSEEDDEDDDNESEEEESDGEDDDDGENNFFNLNIEHDNSEEEADDGEHNYSEEEESDGEHNDSEEEESDGEHNNSEEEESDGELNSSEEEESDGEHNNSEEESDGEDNNSEEEEDDGEHADSEEDDGEHDDSEEDEVDSEQDNERLEISAPYLRSLEISGCIPRNCQLRNISSLVDATLDCDLDRYDDNERIQDTLRGLLESLVHVKRLTLGAQAAKVGV